MKEKGALKMGNIEGKIGYAQRGKNAALHNAIDAIGVISREPRESTVIASDEARSD